MPRTDKLPPLLVDKAGLLEVLRVALFMFNMETNGVGDNKGVTDNPEAVNVE